MKHETIIKLCEGIDYVTQHLAIELLGDEENHRREFTGLPARKREVRTI